MGDRAIARRYAKAFSELAEEAGVTEVLGADLERTLQVLNAHDRMLFTALANPVFTTDERRRVLDAFLPRLQLHDLSRNLLVLMLEKGRFDSLPEVHEVFSEYADLRAGRVRVRVATAEPLSPQLEAEVRSSFERLTGKTVLLETHIDPSLIGGLVARVGSRVYDASVRSRLQELRQRLIAAHETAEA